MAERNKKNIDKGPRPLFTYERLDRSKTTGNPIYRNVELLEDFDGKKKGTRYAAIRVDVHIYAWETQKALDEGNDDYDELCGYM